MEQIDVFDEFLNPLPQSPVSIDTVHQQGLWHQTFACWLVHAESGRVYLQLRGPKNRVGAHTFDATAGGHLSAGEKPVDGFRELWEEVGDIPLSDPVYLGINRSFFQKENYVNREFCHVFMATTPASLADFSLQAGEVSDLFALPVQDGIDLFSGWTETATVVGATDTRAVTINDFCCAKERTLISGYYLKIFLMAQKLLRNEPPYRI